MEILFILASRWFSYQFTHWSRQAPYNPGFQFHLHFLFQIDYSCKCFSTQRDGEAGEKNDQYSRVLRALLLR